MTQTSSQAKQVRERLEEAKVDALSKYMPSADDQAKADAETVVDDIADIVMRNPAFKGWDKNTRLSIQRMIEEIDARMSDQLSQIMHDENFQALEGSWRGLHRLVHNSETGSQLQIKVTQRTKRELQKDLSSASDFDQSTIFRQVYEENLDMPGGVPFAALIGDYQFGKHNDDMEVLEGMSKVAAAGFCPFVTAPSPDLFDLKSFEELKDIRSLSETFDQKSHIRWRSFRESDDSRFVVMTMPRMLARTPYGRNTKSIDEFNFEELPLDEQGNSVPVSHDRYTWSNAAYALGGLFTDSFAKTGWCTRTRGYDNGGRVEGLPTHIFLDDSGDMQDKCPTEIGITGRRENELSSLGFLPLCHYKDTDYAVFFGGQSVQKPKKYSGPDKDMAEDNAKVMARLQYILTASRIAHCLKVMVRNMIGDMVEREDMEARLRDWISDYVLEDEKASDEMKLRYPLAEAKIDVVTDGPGEYRAVAHLRPWLYLEKLQTSIRMVAKLPEPKGG